MELQREGNPFYRFCSAAAIALILAVFLALSLIGAYSTCVVEIGYSADNDEHVAFLADSVFWNVLALAAGAAFVWLLNRLHATARMDNLAAAVVFLILTVFGIFWVVGARALPYADSQSILLVAEQLAAGNVQALTQTDYFSVFPFQLGYLLYAEGFFRIFGTETARMAMAVANVLWVDAAYLALLMLTKRLFPSPKVARITVALLGLCWQPVFLSTFLYGFLPGMALALWGVYFVVRYLQRGSVWNLALASALLAMAIVLKKNYVLVLLACGIVLLLHTMNLKRLLTLAGIALMAAMAIVLPKAVQRGYEQRAGAQFGSGTPLTAWLVTGVSESSFCSGWYGSYTTTVLRDSGFDQQAAKEAIRLELSEQLEKFSGRPRYLAAFFYHKIVSQWNEPMFQSIWSSATSAHAAPPAAWVEELYSGTAGQFVSNWCNNTVEFIYAGFAAAMWLMLRKPERRGKRTIHLPRREEQLILPVVVLGAFLYHAIFEAKSQYAVVYLPMMIPFAAAACQQLTDRHARAD